MNEYDYWNEPELDIEEEFYHDEYLIHEHCRYIISFRSKDVILNNGELWRVELVTFHTGHRECNRIPLDHTPWDGSIPF